MLFAKFCSLSGKGIGVYIEGNESEVKWNENNVCLWESFPDRIYIYLSACYALQLLHIIWVEEKSDSSDLFYSLNYIRIGIARGGSLTKDIEDNAKINASTFDFATNSVVTTKVKSARSAIAFCKIAWIETACLSAASPTALSYKNEVKTKQQ